LNLGALEDGTAIGSAISAAVNRLRDIQAKSKIVVLMTDGQNNAGKVPPITAAEAAQALGIRIYTIGVGTRGIARVPYVNVFGQKGYIDQKVDIDEEMLTKVAEMTGGKYFRAENTAGLRKIYDEIDKLEKTEVEINKYQRFRELYPYFVLAGLAILLLEIILGNTVWRRLP
jgi:Ca-activated chloride channel homolog